MEMKWFSDTMKMTVRWKVGESSQIEPENYPSKCEKQTKEEMIGERGEFWALSEKNIEHEVMLWSQIDRCVKTERQVDEVL